MTCLLDNGAQINFVTPAYAHKWEMDIMSLDHLAQEIGGQIPPIAGIGGIMVEPKGFMIMNVQIPCVKGYNEDQIYSHSNGGPRTERLSSLPGHGHDLSSDGGHQGEPDLRAGYTMVLLETLLVDERRPCSNESVGSQRCG